MNLPTVVQQLLGEIAFQVVPSDDAQNDADYRLRTVLLRDEQGAVQIISRHQDLVDISILNKKLQRNLRPVSDAEGLQLCKKFGLSEPPALPGIARLPVIIDTAVDTLQMVAVELPDSNRVMRLHQDDFRVIAPDAERQPFAAPIERVTADYEQSPEEDAGQLHATLKRFTSLRIQQRLEDTLELPPLPQTAQRIIKLRVSSNVVLGDLVDIVESDPSLAAQVVSWASSSFYAAGGQVKSVQDAVARVLGFDMVMNLAMGLALGRTLNPPEDHPEGYISYWQQAIWQAQAASTLTRLMPREIRPAEGLAYLSGLLHNFGYLVLGHVFPPHFKLMCRSMEVNTHVDTSVIEHHFLGITRETIASQLMANWGMPDEITSAIRQQKNPVYSGEHSRYAQLIWLGRQLLVERGVALGYGEPVAESIYRELGLDEAAVADKFDDLVSAQDSIKAMASMVQTAH